MTGSGTVVVVVGGAAAIDTVTLAVSVSAPSLIVYVKTSTPDEPGFGV
jgi:hypothetical protein